MTAKIPESHRDLFDRKSLAHLATIMPDGSPQVTPVWVSYDGEHVLVNSARGRVKDRNMIERPRVALNIQDPDSLYRYLLIRGTVIEHTTEGAQAHINALTLRYVGQREFVTPEGQVRVLYKILPEHVTTGG